MDELNGIEDEYDPSTLEEGEHEVQKSGTVPTWAVPLALVALVVGLVVVALIRDAPSFDPTTPEGAVQEYLTAIKDHRWADAEAVLDPDTYGTCDIEAIREPFEPFTAVHQSTMITGTHAWVDVLIRNQGGGIFGGGYDQHIGFSLVLIDRHWYISGTEWPWFMWQCAGFR